MRSARLEDHAGEPGVRPLRHVLDKHTFRLSDDELELLFRPLAAAAGLPYPATQTRDALRFQTHTAAGLTPLRFSHWQVKYEPAHVETILKRTAANLRA